MKNVLTFGLKNISANLSEYFINKTLTEYFTFLNIDQNPVVIALGVVYSITRHNLFVCITPDVVRNGRPHF